MPWNASEQWSVVRRSGPALAEGEVRDVGDVATGEVHIGPGPHLGALGVRTDECTARATRAVAGAKFAAKCTLSNATS